MSANLGLYNKFGDIERRDGRSARGEKHHGCEYFILDLTHDVHAVSALRGYILSCQRSHPQLAEDLKRTVNMIVLGFDGTEETEEQIEDQGVEFTCGTCNARRLHRYCLGKRHWLCDTCGAVHTLGVDREKLAEIYGPWEGFHTCNVCCKVVEYNEYYRNSSVCPHCGVGGMGIVRSARRKVFTKSARNPPTLWQRLLAMTRMYDLVEVERPFDRWEVKES